VQGAVVTSLGLALATWSPRVGRAVAVSVVSFVVFAFGWPVLLDIGIVTELLSWLGLLQGNNSDDFVEIVLMTACPLGAQFGTFVTATMLPEESRGSFYIAEITLFLATLLVAFSLLGLTLATFDRSMGRVSERARQPRRKPRRMRLTHKKHGRPLDVRQPGLAETHA
jgi:hypothetical protein